MKYHYVWLLWSSTFLLPWGLLYGLFATHRRVMLKASLLTMPFGLTEALFVPEYWSPPSLFDLALRTGFDIESFIFSFALGGIGVVLYGAATRKAPAPVAAEYRRLPLHRHHVGALAAPLLAFPLLFGLPWNVIYPAIGAMTVGAIANVLCRPELKRNTWLGGLLFLGLYAIFIGGLERMVPGYIGVVWNLEQLTGILLLQVPVEEYLFAFAFGTYWAGVYEHLTWRSPVSVTHAVTAREQTEMKLHGHAEEYS